MAAWKYYCRAFAWQLPFISLADDGGEGWGYEPTVRDNRTMASWTNAQNDRRGVS